MTLSRRHRLRYPCYKGPWLGQDNKFKVPRWPIHSNYTLPPSLSSSLGLSGLFLDPPSSKLHWIMFADHQFLSIHLSEVCDCIKSFLPRLHLLRQAISLTYSTDPKAGHSGLTSCSDMEEWQDSVDCSGCVLFVTFH